MDVVEIIRRRAGGARTGHAGTLDPLATGVLVIAMGRATKIINRLMATEKRYRTTIDLSAFTSTDDAEGVRTDVPVSSPPTEPTVRQALSRFVGRIDQRPPMFSAVKIGGRRAYKLARRGEAVQIEPRMVMVHGIEFVSYQWPRVVIDIHCDKGFYVRSLARDLGEKLGAGGFCESIRRTAVGPFTLAMAKSLETLPDVVGQNDLLTIEQALKMMEASP
jgi:tRNA pseudouridine55 synthase